MHFATTTARRKMHFEIGKNLLLWRHCQPLRNLSCVVMARLSREERAESS